MLISCLALQQVQGMQAIEYLLETNRRWADSHLASDPEYFTRTARQQTPEYMWIGCSDSRVPANQIVGLSPGRVFVHRNIANLVVHSDMNCLSVLQYAVDVLHIRDVIVCGHYGCGGVQAAMSGNSYGLIDNWLRYIKDVYTDHSSELEMIADREERINRLCEINVVQQVANLCYTNIVQEAWRRGQSLTVHGLIYDLHTGLIRNMGVSIEQPGQIKALYRFAMDSALSH